MIFAFIIISFLMVEVIEIIQKSRAEKIYPKKEDEFDDSGIEWNPESRI